MNDISALIKDLKYDYDNNHMTIEEIIRQAYSDGYMDGAEKIKEKIKEVEI